MKKDKPEQILPTSFVIFLLLYAALMGAAKVAGVVPESRSAPAVSR